MHNRKVINEQRILQCVRTHPSHPLARLCTDVDSTNEVFPKRPTDINSFSIERKKCERIRRQDDTYSLSCLPFRVEINLPMSRQVAEPSRQTQRDHSSSHPSPSKALSARHKGQAAARTTNPTTPLIAKATAELIADHFVSRRHNVRMQPSDT
tara:strand:- start:26818 stop:27276 length:459 start_codon:yes stop_codon:yes gene_type:complete